jgi:hypothetical protein
MLHMLQWLCTYVSNVSYVLEVCCKCFYLNVAKVDLNVAYTYMLQVYRCFIRLLQVFHLDVAYVCNDFQVFFRCFCKCFKRMFQEFYLSSFVYCNYYIWMF